MTYAMKGINTIVALKTSNMINVGNIKNGDKGEKIYRGISVFGNPFTVKEYGRDKCIELYREWLRNEWKKNGKVKEELIRLAKLYKKEDVLNLACYCAPLACHGDVLAEAIQAIVDKGLV